MQSGVLPTSSGCRSSGASMRASSSSRAQHAWTNGRVTRLQQLACPVHGSPPRPLLSWALPSHSISPCAAAPGSCSLIVLSLCQGRARSAPPLGAHFAAWCTSAPRITATTSSRQTSTICPAERQGSQPGLQQPQHIGTAGQRSSEPGASLTVLADKVGQELGIRPPLLSLGKPTRHLCPFCGGGSNSEMSFSISAMADEGGGPPYTLYNCFRCVRSGSEHSRQQLCHRTVRSEGLPYL